MSKVHDAIKAAEKRVDTTDYKAMGTCKYCNKKAKQHVLKQNCGACTKSKCILQAMRDNL